MIAQTTILNLTYPPICLCDIRWAEQNNMDFIKKAISNSNLYMIGKKPKALFQCDAKASIDGWISFSISQNGKSCSGKINPALCARLYLDTEQHNYCCSVGKKCQIKFEYFPDKIWISVETPKFEKMVCYTPEAICQLKSKRAIFLHGFDNYKDFCNYELLYVGESVDQNTWNRIASSQSSHHKKSVILTDEKVIDNSSSIGEEIYLFPFKVSKIEHLNALMPGMSRKEVDRIVKISMMSEQQRHDFYIKTTLDAEKAYAHSLKTKYNKTTFKKYPFSTNGLHDENLNRYCFVIKEDLHFSTQFAEINGSTDIYDGNTDTIMIDNSKGAEKVYIAKLEKFISFDELIPMSAV